MRPGHPHWEQAISRRQASPLKTDEIRSEFDRDNGRILHSLAYSRLKSKTQVFFHTNDDRICTRIEHVNHVISVSSTIARFLGLNSELTYAIAMGHDLGHAPFGHSGEVFLDEICQKQGLGEFWHEKNSLHVVDNIELLQDTQGHFKNLNLTYAVRDSEIDGHKVKKGEMMGLCGKKLLALEKTPEKAALKLLTAMVDEETQFVNIFTGADVTPAAASRLEEQARRKLGTHVELAVIPGGQPVYSYILSVE